MQSSDMTKKMDKQKWYVIKLGGSILVPDLPDTEFLKEFRTLLLDRIENYNERFVIVPGGGKTCRNYQRVLEELACPVLTHYWIGIYSGELNAQLVRLSFGDHAFPEIHMTPDTMPTIETVTTPLIIGGSGTPGNSHNLGAVQFAKYAHAHTVINLSNIDYVYSADPKDDPDAVQYPEVSWKKYLTFIPETFDPGAHVPFDPVASKLARDSDIDVVFMKGNPVSNLKHYLETGEVQGTIISNRFE